MPRGAHARALCTGTRTSRSGADGSIWRKAIVGLVGAGAGAELAQLALGVDLHLVHPPALADHAPRRSGREPRAG